MKNLKVGIQLYSLRDELAKDMDATLKRVKEMGYDYVEFAGFYDKSAEEIKALLDKHGLIAVSMHQSLDPYLSENAEEFISFVKTLGIKYSAVPWMDSAVFHDEVRYADFLETSYGYSGILDYVDPGDRILVYRIEYHQTCNV